MVGSGDILDLHQIEKRSWWPSPAGNPIEPGKSSLATGEFEAPNPSAPIEGAVRFQILRGVEERAIVGRVNSHCAVVAPAAQVALLRASAGLQRVFGLQRSKRISRYSSRKGDGGKDGAAGDTVAQCYVANFIHSDTAHPARVAVG